LGHSETTIVIKQVNLKGHSEKTNLIDLFFLISLNYSELEWIKPLLVIMVHDDLKF